MIAIKKLTKTFLDKTLFKDISFTIHENNRACITGSNGNGKSTMLKIIADQMSPDSGEVTINGKKSIGFLHQDFIEDSNKTIWDEITSEFTEIRKVDSEIQRVCKQMEVDYNEKIMNNYSRLVEEYEKIGGYIFESKIKTILTQFGFLEKDFNREVKTLSGGEKFKVAFAKILAKNYDILILDEPTNHLDINTIMWLEGYLKLFAGTLIIVTHDRRFIDKVATLIIEIENEDCLTFKGNYTQFLKEKEDYINRSHKMFRKQQKEIQRMEDLIRRFKGQANKRNLVLDRERKLKRMDVVTKYKVTNKKIKMDFKKSSSMSDILRIENASFGYDKPLIKNVNLNLYSGEKIAIIGRNGIGKSTLIKTILNEIELLDGSVNLMNKVKVGYMDQYLNILNNDYTLLEYMSHIHTDGDNKKARDLLGKYYFRQEDVMNKISSLSGGERVRLFLLTLELYPIDLLILDEPSNHLDMTTKEIFVNALKSYEGAIICISHDRYFLKGFTDTYYKIENFELNEIDEDVLNK